MTDRRPILITGGAGFIGSNIADSLLAEGRPVILLDALARNGVEANVEWLKSRHGERVDVCVADIRDHDVVSAKVACASAIIHLAAQVAVTTSLSSPYDDFAVNAQGTINVLEAARRLNPSAPLVFASTNKVYGHLERLEVEPRGDRYVPSAKDISEFGVSESQPLDFATPYGCSKGAADQYVLDYARTFGLRASVLRMSCIYGPRQFGTEDQGWVAHFLIQALGGAPITIYGDGRQVRDVLHVADAVAAYRAVLAGIDSVAGRAFNLGGGPANAVSLRAMLAEIAALTGQKLDVRFAEWRPGDQLWFVADTRMARNAIGWEAQRDWRDGLRDLAAWLRDNAETVRMARAGEPERLIA